MYRTPIALIALGLLFPGCGPASQTPTQTSTHAPAPSTSQPRLTTADDGPSPTVGNSAKPGDATPSKASLLESRLPDEELADGWISLFDGQSLFGWEAGSEANWQVQDGIIQVSEGEKGLLCTTTEFTNYVLRLEFRFSPGTNSGIFLHTPLRPTDPTKDCYELNIAERTVSPYSTGSFVNRQKTELDAAPDTWHEFEVTLDGSRAQVKLNGQPALDYTDAAPLLRGRIGLQLNQGKVEFRKVRCKPLNLESLIAGEGLDGWAELPAGGEVFKRTPDGAIRAKGGKARLESNRQFADFVVQMECRTEAPGINSGLFFRCIPGEDMNGYESQIQNQFQDNDRSSPRDCGTGGIFRRTNARFVVADDLKWFHKTIIASGAHVAVWVDGIQVTDWTDTRSADPNPRKGLRLDAGSLMLQAHDSTTDVSFRNIQAVELPRRAELPP